ncbi:MFS transporter [Comamonas testosteroni]|uniref:MFS transporter n=1 Tax=Comamonas testosteroni TaxID=285 RepID=A0A373FEW1_COMTE|nr:MFS transporter [Comamonas testosteroni]RGE42683.1 MFS transporter [Comamonas testosteroni]
MSVSSSASAPGLSASSLLLMALACGLCAGGNYFNQPLLHSIAEHFSVAESAAAASVTLAQVAYASGLLLLAPLGDKLQRRGLAVSLMLLAAAGQALCGLATGLSMFLWGTLMAGLFSVAAQVLVPMAAALAQPGQSGRAVGWVMSGLLLGILLARSVAGVVSDAWGWQAAVYQGAALVMAVVALWLWKALPASRNPSPVSYPQVLSSMWRLLRTQPGLRQRTLVSGLAFASVSVLFSTMALQLSAGPLGLDDGQIGLIGLAGAAGALVATQAGRLVDKGLGRVSCAIGALALLLSWPMLWWGGAHLGWFVLGMVVIDLSLQCLNITNQATVAQLLPAARGRMNAVYMTGYFTGAAAGSALGTLAWRINGWLGACALGVALALLAGLGTFSMRKTHALVPAAMR